MPEEPTTANGNGKPSGKRKVYVAIAGIGGIVGLCYAPISVDMLKEMSTNVLWIVGLFIAGNSVEHAKSILALFRGK